MELRDGIKNKILRQGEVIQLQGNAKPSQRDEKFRMGIVIQVQGNAKR